MSRNKTLLKPFPWHHYSYKLQNRIENPLYVGSFSEEEAESKELRCVIGKERALETGWKVALYWLVDKNDGVIADAKFHAFGPSSLIGACDAASEIVLRKNYEQARRISGDLLDKLLRDRSGDPAFPEESLTYLNFVLSAIDHAADQCTDIPIEEVYIAPPLSFDQGSSTGGYPGWKELAKEQKIAVIEKVIAEDIRPYIELDAGGVQIVDFVDDQEVIIAYQGSCTSCYSATGATLNAIQQVLQAKIDPLIRVVADPSSLNLSN